MGVIPVCDAQTGTMLPPCVQGSMGACEVLLLNCTAIKRISHLNPCTNLEVLFRSLSGSTKPILQERVFRQNSECHRSLPRAMKISAGLSPSLLFPDAVEERRSCWSVGGCTAGVGQEGDDQRWRQRAGQRRRQRKLHMQAD